MGNHIILYMLIWTVHSEIQAHGIGILTGQKQIQFRTTLRSKIVWTRLERPCLARMCCRLAWGPTNSLDFACADRESAAIDLQQEMHGNAVQATTAKEEYLIIVLVYWKIPYSGYCRFHTDLFIEPIGLKMMFSIIYLYCQRNAQNHVIWNCIKLYFVKEKWGCWKMNVIPRANHWKSGCDYEWYFFICIPFHLFFSHKRIKVFPVDWISSRTETSRHMRHTSPMYWLIMKP